MRYGGGSIIRINIVSVSGAEQNAFEIRRKLFFLEFDMQTVMFGDGGFRQFRESAFFRMAADKFRFAAVFENLVLQFKFQQFAGKGSRGGQADGKGVFRGQQCVEECRVFFCRFGNGERKAKRNFFGQAGFAAGGIGKDKVKRQALHGFQIF